MIKWLIRALMAMGAMLGLASCSGPKESVYGPPPTMDTTRVQERHDEGSDQSAQPEDANHRPGDLHTDNPNH